jgi:hypothetical protein
MAQGDEELYYLGSDPEISDKYNQHKSDLMRVLVNPGKTIAK